MTAPNNPTVSTLVDAINTGDREAFMATLTPDATLTDDGALRCLADWIDREIFNVHGHLTVESQDQSGLQLIARYRNDKWGEMRTSWIFHLQGDKIQRIDTSQA